jgi:signal transduction histidine kinase
MPSDLDERLAFLNFGDEDRQRLAALAPVLEQHADDLVDAFYRHLLAFPETRSLLRDPVVKQRLLAVQRSYLLGLASPSLDAEYLTERRRIGETHDRVGLEPRWYLGAYALYLSLLVPVICSALEPDSEEAQRTVAALQKILFLDAQIAMEAYIARHHRELEYLTEELASEGRRLARDYQDQSAALRTTESRAQAAEELASVGALVAGLAHEIGTPMGVIQGHAKLLEGAVSGDSAEWRLRTIQDQIGRISRIIQTLLNMARPKRSQRLPVDLAALLEASLAFLQEKLRLREIRVETHFTPGVSLIGDSERLQQLFLNLFLNAADAMPDGGELRVSVSDTGEDGIEVRVADTGAGISEQARARIFEPFFTTKPAGEGNGLGLMVAHGVVTDHGGSIELSEDREVGSEFVLRFPVLEAS